MDLNTVSLTWGPVPTDGINGELIAYAVVIQASNIMLIAGPCHSSLEFNNHNFSADTCIQMAAFTKAGLGKLTDCITIDIGK